MALPNFLLLRHGRDVYLIDTARQTFELLDPADSANDLYIQRTQNSPFLDGLAFAGAYASTADIGLHAANN